jgi:glycine/D-amino acid oxidase-like deaminating enzyme
VVIREPELDVVVVGAGLAGLAAARHLVAAGRAVRVLEAGDGVGGRMHSEVVDGITVDRGFQLLNPAYPEAARVLDLPALHLRSFDAGVLLAGRDGRHVVADPRRRPGAALSSALHTPGTRAQQVRFLAYVARLASGDGRRLLDVPDTTVAEGYAAFGALTDRVLAPFLSGVLFDDSMTSSRLFADLLLRTFVRGTPAVPAHGMQEIPDQLAAGVDVGLGTHVHAVTPTSVTTDDGVLVARAVIVATDAGAAATLLPGLDVPVMRSGTTWWHLADTPGSGLTDGRPLLVVDPDRRGPLVNTVVVSNAAPAYSRDGRALVASTAIGTGPHDEREVRDHLTLLYGADTTNWDEVVVHRIAATVPAVPVGSPVRRAVRHDGVYVAGDHRDTASIQGALVSGRRIAEAVLRSLA